MKNKKEIITYKKEDLYIIPVVKVLSIDVEKNIFKHKKLWYGIFVKANNSEFIHISTNKTFQQIDSSNIYLNMEGICKDLVKRFDECFKKTIEKNTKLLNHEWTVREIEALETKFNEHYDLSL